MLKLACSFTGDNYQLLSTDTPASKKKVVAMALAMLIPVLIWVFNGFMLSYEVLKAGWLWAIVTAAACGCIVFLIEKLIIMANGNNWLKFFRILIGLVIAGLGSVAIDEVVFSSDIDISVSGIKEQVITNAKKKEDANFVKLNNLLSLEKSIKEAQVKSDIAEITAIKESDGSGGTGQHGLGSVAKFKDEKALLRRKDVNALSDKYGSLIAEKESAVKQAGETAMANFNEHALLTRIKALFHLVREDDYMLTVYILFTLLMFFFEFLVVVLKSTWKKTNYERKLEMIEEIGIRRMEFLLKKDSPASDPGYYLPQFEQARSAVKKNYTMYN